MSKLLRVSLVGSASKKGRLGNMGLAPFADSFSSCSFSERVERSEKPFRKRHCVSKFLGVFLFCSIGKKQRPWEHKALKCRLKLLLLKLLFRMPKLGTSTRNKQSAQRSFGPDIPVDIWPKTSVRTSKSRKKTLAWTSRGDVHEKTSV